MATIDILYALRLDQYFNIVCIKETCIECIDVCRKLNLKLDINLYNFIMNGTYFLCVIYEKFDR